MSTAMTAGICQEGRNVFSRVTLHVIDSRSESELGSVHLVISNSSTCHLRCSELLDPEGGVALRAE